MNFDVYSGDSKLPGLISYMGSKRNFHHVFDTLVPTDCTNFFDVFGGSGAFTFWAKNRNPNISVVYNDNNQYICNLMKRLKTSPENLYEVYNHIIGGNHDLTLRERYDKARDIFNNIRDDPIQRPYSAGLLLFLSKHCFGSVLRFNKKGECNSTFRNTMKKPIQLVRDDVFMYSKLLENVFLYSEPYTAPYLCFKNMFVYIDPPYINNKNGAYNGSINEDRFKLYVSIMSKNNKVMISEQNIYDFGKEFTRHDITLHRSIHPNHKTTREYIYTNY